MTTKHPVEITRDSPNKELVAAIMANDLAACRRLAAVSPDINVHLDTSPLALASKAGNVAACNILLKAGASATGGPAGALSWAIFNGDVELCRLLVDAGADIFERDSTGRTFLIRSAVIGTPEICQFLVDCGIDVDAASEYGTALMAASSFGNIGVVKLLLSAGANASLSLPSRDEPTLTAFQLAVKHGKEAVVEHCLTMCAEDPAQRTADGKTMRQLAGKNTAIQQLLNSAKTMTSICKSMTEHDSDGKVGQVRGPMPPL